MVEGALQAGLSSGKLEAVGPEGRSELDTRRFVAQGQEIKAIKAKCHSQKKKNQFFAYSFPMQGTELHSWKAEAEATCAQSASCAIQ